MLENKTDDTKNLYRRSNWFWLITYGAVIALVIPDRSPFMTVLIWIVIICGTASCVFAQQRESEERAPRSDGDD